MTSRRRLLLVGAVLVVIVLAGLLLRASVRRDLGIGGGADQSVPGVVLLVPGYGGGEDALRVLQRRLTAQGRDARIVPARDGGTGDLRVQASALDRAVQTATAAGAPSVDLVGFSAGGVVVRLWLAAHDGGRVARRIVTLGSPHHGADVAAAAAALAPTQCPEACRQLVPGSDLLDGLNGRDETPAGPRWVSIWTLNDQTVTPPDSARLGGAVNVVVQDVCPGVEVAHGDLPRNAISAGLALEALGPGLSEPPAASDCARLWALGATPRA
jgi:triacylglycerol lipase